jgi:integrase
VERDEVRALFAACDDSPAGRRDAAMLAILHGGGLRRAELCGLDVVDFDASDCVLSVRSGKGRRDRRVFLSAAACKIVKRWISARGSAAGPLFVPISAGGTVRLTRLRGEAVRYILQRRQRQARLTGITPHAMRRAYVSELLAAGVDVFTVQRLAGHADAVTAARYDRRGEGERRRAAAQLRIPVAT